MAKRNVIQGGFALPGLAKEPEKHSGFKFKFNRGKAARKPVEQQGTGGTEISSTSKTCTLQNRRTNNVNQLDDSSSLVDESGELLAPKVNGRLDHLTKSRPRSPGRRSGNGRRERSRSPNRNPGDSFDYNLGVECNFGSVDSNGKVLPSKTDARLSSSEVRNQSNSSTTLPSPESVVVRDVDLSKLTNVLITSPQSESPESESSFMDARVGLYSPGSPCTRDDMRVENTGFHARQYSLQSDDDQDDIGDMLIGDYVDSESESDHERPPLPSSPPPLDEELETIVQTDSRTSSSLERQPGKNYAKSDSQTDQNSKSEKSSLDFISSKQTHSHPEIPKSPNKYFPSIDELSRHTSLPDKGSSYGGSRGSEHSSKLVSKSESLSFDGSDTISGTSKTEHAVDPKLSCMFGYGARTSKFGENNRQASRRRHFKPVSLDPQPSENIESDTLVQTFPAGTNNKTDSDTDKLNTTFPRTYPERGPLDPKGSSCSNNRREIDWGLRTGTLNTSFSESPLKSGTIFDRFLQRKELRSHEQQEQNTLQHRKIQQHQKQEPPLSSLSEQSLIPRKTYWENDNPDTYGISNSSQHDVTNKVEKDFYDVPWKGKMKQNITQIFKTEQVSQDSNIACDDRTTQDVENTCYGACENELPNGSDENDDTKNDNDDYTETYNSIYDAGTEDIDDDNDDLYDVSHNGLFDDDDDDNIIDDIDEVTDLPRLEVVPKPNEMLSADKDEYPGDVIPDDRAAGSLSLKLPKLPSKQRKETYLDEIKYNDDDASHESNILKLSDTSPVSSLAEEQSLNYSDDFSNDLTSSQGSLSGPEWSEDRVKELLPSHALFGGNDKYVVGQEYDGKTSEDGNEDTSSDEGSNLGDYIDNRSEEMATDGEQEEIIESSQVFAVEASEKIGDALFQPPPMFASDEELDVPDFTDVPPLLTIPEEIMPVAKKKLMPFHKIPLGDWTEEDAREWLDYVGLGHFKEEFKAYHVNGRTLKNINFQLLEEIGINSPDEREIVLSEIYELDNPREEENLETEIQDALETASEQDKEKILAVLTALKSPALRSGVELPAPSTGSSSPRDSDAGYHLSSDTTSLASSVTASDELSQRGSAGVTPSHSHTHLSQVHSQPTEKRYNIGKAKGEPAKPQETDDFKDNKKTKDTKKRKSKKEKKRISKFWESLSLSHTSAKLNKLFRSKKLNPTMQYLLQAGPQGIVRVWPVSLTAQTKYCSFMVSMTTTSSQVIHMVLEKYDIVADPLRYYLCEVGTGKKGVNHVLEDGDCPLWLQCRWSDPEKYHFELRCRDEGVVKMLFELEGYEDDLDYRSIGISSRTPCKDLMPLIVSKYDMPGTADDYQLMEVSEENEDDRQVVADHVFPLKLQKAWNEPDHVFRFVKKRTSSATQWVPPTIPEDLPSSNVKYAAGMSSAVSSMRGDYETDSTDHQDHTSDENLTFQAFPDTSKELDEVVLEVQDQIAVQQAPEGGSARSRGQSITMEAQLDELREKEAELLSKEREIVALREHNQELLEKEKELVVWRIRNKELVEREEEVEVFKFEQEKELTELQEMRENEGNDLLMRDREIERLYARNKELINIERECEELKNKTRGFVETEEKLEYLQRVNRESVVTQQQLIGNLELVQRSNEQLESQVRELNNSRAADKDRATKVEFLRQELETSGTERVEALRKLGEVQRRNVLLERSSELLEDMRRENETLAAKAKDMDEMKKNIIRLTSQLREADILRLSQGELDDLKLRLGICQAEKQQLQTRVDEVERRNSGLRESRGELHRLVNENRILREQVEELEVIRFTVAGLKTELNEAEELRQKFRTLLDIEKSLNSDLKAQDGVIKQKNRRIEELERQITMMTDAMTKMERKSEEQEQQRENLNHLLAIIKDRDPTLLQALHRSLAGGEQEGEEEEEEWC